VSTAIIAAFSATIAAEAAGTGMAPVAVAARVNFATVREAAVSAEGGQGCGRGEGRGGSHALIDVTDRAGLTGGRARRGPRGEATARARGVVREISALDRSTATDGYFS